MRLSLALLATLALLAGCVDGKTPDCSTPQSGCAPGDGGSSPTDASDAASSDAPAADAPSSSDAASDAPTD